MYNRAHVLAFAVAIFGNLLATGNGDFITLSIDEQHFLAQYLIYLTGNNFTDNVLVLLIQNILLQIFYFLDQRLAGCGHGSAAKMLNTDLLGHFLAYFKIRFNFPRLTQADLIMIPNVLGVIVYNLPNPVNLQVSFIRVHDDIEVIIRDILFLDHRTKHIFQDADHRRAINVLLLREVGKRLDQRCGIHGWRHLNETVTVVLSISENGISIFCSIAFLPLPSV